MLHESASEVNSIGGKKPENLSEAFVPEDGADLAARDDVAPDDHDEKRYGISSRAQPPKGNGELDRPIPLSVHAGNIPAELKRLNRWLVWKYATINDEQTGKPKINPKTGKVDWTKKPLNARGGAGSSTNRGTWSTHEQAIAAYERGGCDGVGFALSAKKAEADPELVKEDTGLVLTAIDLDHCRDRQTGEIDSWAREIVEELSTHCEVSPSGGGLRLFAYGRLPADGVKRGDTEVYRSGKYVTVTGQRVNGTPATIEEREAQLLAIHKRIWPELHTPKQAAAGQSAATSVAAAPPARNASSEAGVGLTDDEIIEKARNSRNPAKFRRLFDDGDMSDYLDKDGRIDESAAEEALCFILAFWTRDSAQIDRIFRRSALLRPEKWDRETYRNPTISKALAKVTEHYSPGWHRNGTTPQHSTSAPKSDRAEPKKYSVGDLTLQAGTPKQTPSKINVPLFILRDGRRIDQIGLSESMNSRRQAARQIASHLGVGVARESIDSLLGEIIASAGQVVESTPIVKVGSTLRDIVAARVPPVLSFACSTKNGLWSERHGNEMRRCDLLAFTPSWLVSEAEKAVDAPRDAQGIINRPALLRAMQSELGVLWSDLQDHLPREADVDLGHDTERGRQFRAAMIHLWKVPVTWERQQTAGGDTATRASLASRIISAKHRPAAERLDRCKWQTIHPACDAWWRTWIAPEGELVTLLAMRWTLCRQVGIDLPGVTDQESLTRLGMQFGCLQKPPEGIPSRLSGGANRLSVLSLDLSSELLELPSEDPEDNPREPGCEG